MARQREIHVAPGPSAGGCLNQVLRPAPGTLLANHDVLSCGPLLPIESLEQWWRLREDYLRTVDDPELPPFSFAKGGRDLLGNIDLLRDAGTIVLWVGTGLAEQILLVWLVQVLRLVGVGLERLRVIQFSAHPTQGWEVYSVGLLHPDALASHTPARGLSDEEIASLDAAWAAITAPEPERLLRLISGPPGPLPFLHRSLRGLLNRYPAFTNGLNWWDTQLLRFTDEEGPEAVRVVAFALIEYTDAGDLVGDAYLFARLCRLGKAELPRPLVQVTDEGAGLRGARVRLTDAGREVRAGRLNAVELNGIDDWVGGVHLSSAKGTVWFHRSGTFVRGC